MTTRRESEIRRDLYATTDRADLERRIVDLLERLSPREIRQLRTSLAAPQLAVAVKLKAAIRDAVLGRDDARGRYAPPH